MAFFLIFPPPLKIKNYVHVNLYLTYLNILLIFFGLFEFFSLKNWLLQAMFFVITGILI